MTAVPFASAIPWPTRHTKLTEWADSLKLLRPDFDINPQLLNEKSWKDWAGHLIQSQPLQTAASPRPEGYSDWKPWAEALIKSLGSQN